MNILTIAVLILLLICAIDGFRKGLVEGMIRLVSTFIGIIVLYVLLKGLGNFLQGNMLNVIMALIILIGIRLIHKIIKLILDSCKLVSRIPVMSLIDKVSGIILGVVQGIIIVWLVFMIGGYFHFGIGEHWIYEQIDSSHFLSALYHSNYIIYFISKL